MRRLALALVAILALIPPAARAADEGRLVQLPESLALTPDGSTLVFSWRGDLWRVASTGGAARRLTTHPAPDTRPHVSPDGTRIAFVSTRAGGDQVHVMPLTGGEPTQITTHSEGTRVYGWFPDSKSVLTRSSRDHDWRDADRLFRQPVVAEAQPELLFDAACGHGSVSPDGSLIAFTREGMGWTRKGYRGERASQLWLYDLRAKTYRRLSEGPHGEMWPLWGRDGGTLHYVGEQDGTWNLWTLDIASGRRTQLTHHTDDGVSWPTISADLTTIAYRRLFDVYVVRPGTSRAPERVEIRDMGDASVDLVERRVTTRATAAAFSNDAREIALIADGDVWVMDTELKEPRRVTNTPQEERHPVFSADFTNLWVVSDAAGQADVWKLSRAEDDKYWWQNEQFKAERLTNDAATEDELRLTPDGKRLAFIKEGSLWSMDLDGKDVRRHVESFLGVEWCFSPDGTWIAYAAPDEDFNWDVWLVPADGATPAVNVSQHPDNDQQPAWSPDGKVLAFTGRRWNDETDIAYVWLRAQDDETDGRDRALEKALEKMKGRTAKPTPGSPTPGKDIPAKDAPSAAEAATGPAGRWTGQLQGPPPIPAEGLALVLVLTRADDAWTCAIEVVGQFSGTAETFTLDADAGTFAFALTTPLGALAGEGRIEGGARMSGTWRIEGVMEGTFEARLEEPAATAAEPTPAVEAPKPTEPLHVDWEGIAERVRRIAIPGEAESGLFWSHDSKKLAFRGRTGTQAGLYTVGFPDELTPKFLTATPLADPRWLKEGNQIVGLSGGVPTAIDATGKPTPFAFSARSEVLLPDLHAAVFERVWRIMGETYYDERMGNRDWNALRTKYGAMAAQCATADEVEQVVNMLLGELNGSHLGFNAQGRAWTRPGWSDVTGHLGCRFDEAFEGPGLRVRDVITGTPADQQRTRLVAGEVILTIDARPVGPATDIDRLLTGNPARDVQLRVRAADGEVRSVTLRPTTYGDVRAKLYADELQRTRRAIDERSQGTVGYLHVRSMNWPSFLRFEEDLYKAGHGKDALVIDVRDNGGGFTTDHLLTCLTQPRHAITVPRRGAPGYPHDRMVYAPWHKPVVVLCNQNSFSNAEIFAHAIKTLGRGTVVGVTTAGGVISTGATSVMGFGSLRLPFRGWFLLGDGEDMELNGCVPHHVLWPEPADHAVGRDRQAEKAVDVALEAISAWKARPQPVLRRASQRPGFSRN